MSEQAIIRRRFWFLPLLLITLGCGGSATESNDASSSSSTVQTGPVTIRMVVNGETIESVVKDVADGSTVDEVMRKIQDVDIEIVGSGEMTFVNSIAGQTTDSVSGWTYEVDGEFAEAGIGATLVHPPTTIDWKFGGWGSESDAPASE